MKIIRLYNTQELKTRAKPIFVITANYFKVDAIWKKADNLTCETHAPNINFFSSTCAL